LLKLPAELGVPYLELAVVAVGLLAFFIGLIGL
jgi:hypothetical protein